jgi:hypothetical protein
MKGGLCHTIIAWLSVPTAIKVGLVTERSTAGSGPIARIQVEACR